MRAAGGGEGGDHGWVRGHRPGTKWRAALRGNGKCWSSRGGLEGKNLGKSAGRTNQRAGNGRGPERLERRSQHKRGEQQCAAGGRVGRGHGAGSKQAVPKARERGKGTSRGGSITAAPAWQPQRQWQPAAQQPLRLASQLWPQPAGRSPLPPPPAAAAAVAAAPGC